MGFLRPPWARRPQEGYKCSPANRFCNAASALPKVKRRRFSGTGRGSTCPRVPARQRWLLSAKNLRNEASEHASPRGVGRLRGPQKGRARLHAGRPEACYSRRQSCYAFRRMRRAQVGTRLVRQALWGQGLRHAGTQLVRKPNQRKTATAPLRARERGREREPLMKRAGPLRAGPFRHVWWRIRGSNP